MSCSFPWYYNESTAKNLINKPRGGTTRTNTSHWKKKCDTVAPRPPPRGLTSQTRRHACADRFDGRPDLTARVFEFLFTNLDTSSRYQCLYSKMDLPYLPVFETRHFVPLSRHQKWGMSYMDLKLLLFQWDLIPEGHR